VKEESSTRDDRSWEQWLAIAHQDWLSIENNLKATERPWSAIAFHCQQAAEKYLKAFLAYHGTKPRRIHDLAELLSDALLLDATLDAFAEDCSELTVYAIDSRYPEVPDDYNERVGMDAVASARRVCDGIAQRLGLKNTA
jgi:HEPN domain-containing protein